MNQKENTNKLGSLLIRLLIVPIILLIIAVVFHTSCKLENFVVSGTTRYSSEEIKSFVINKPTDNYAVLFYLRYKFTKKKAVPFVEYMEPVLEDKNTIMMYVYEKLVTGCVKVMGEYMYFDKDGIIVESSAREPSGIPLITGLDYQKLVLNEKLQVQKNDFFETILNLVRLIDLYDLTVERIHFQEEGEVVFYCQETIIYLGKRDMYDEPLSALTFILQSLEGRKVSLDMREYSLENTEIIAKPIE